MKVTIAILAIMLAPPVSAQMYKCESGDSVSYQQLPCSIGNQSVIKVPTPTRSDLTASTQFKTGITLGAFSIRAEPLNSIGNIPISYKVSVTNATSEDQDLYVKYNAIDADGFLIDYEAVSGIVPANSYKILTGRGNFKENEYKRIYKWELDK